MRNKEVKELNSRIDEQLEQLKELAETVVKQRDALGAKIYATKKEIELMNFGPKAVNTENLYDPDSIVEVNEETEGQKYHRLKLYARAYGTNPFCDSGVAAQALAILEQLRMAAGGLDKLYGDEVKRTHKELKAAQAAYNQALAERKEHRRHLMEAVRIVRNAAWHAPFGSNELHRLGAEHHPFPMGSMMVSVSNQGKDIIQSVMDAINRECENMKKRPEIPEPDMRVDNGLPTVEYVPGGPVAFFDPNGFHAASVPTENGLRRWLPGFLK